MSAPRRVLVTGGAGFIGSSLVRALLARGDAVVVLDDFSTGRAENLDGLAGELDVVRGDVTDAELVRRALRGVDAVLHEAAMPSVAVSVEQPLRADLVNVHGVVTVLDEARRAGIRRVLFAASAAAYGDDPTLPQHEQLSPRPLSPYAVAKVTGEQYLKVFATLYGMETLSLRYFNIYGPRQDPRSDYAAAVPRFITKIAAGETPTIFGDGEQTRDFVFIDDVVRANLLGLDAAGLAGQCVNIASGRATSVNALVQTIARIVGREVTPSYGAPRAGEVRHSRAEVRAAREVIGFEAAIDLEEGLRRTVASLRNGA